MTIDKIKSEYRKYDKYLQYKELLKEIMDLYAQIKGILIISKLDSIIKMAREYDSIRKKTLYIKNTKVSQKKNSLENQVTDLKNEINRYYYDIQEFNNLLVQIKNLFLEVVENLTETEIKEFNELKEKLDTVMEINDNLISFFPQELQKNKGRTLSKLSFDISKLNLLDGEIKRTKKWFDEPYQVNIEESEQKEKVTFLKYGKLNFQNDVLFMDDTPFNDQEKMVDLSFDELSIDELVMIHATNFFPEKHEIKSNRGGQKIYTEEINGQIMVFNNSRDTVHFAINGRVSSHIFGNWDKMKYIIIEPIKEHIDQLESFRVVDSWIRGNVELSNKAILLVKDDEYDNLTDEQKKEYEIIKFRGDSAIVVQKLLIMLGYKPQTVKKDNWKNEKNGAKVQFFVNEKYGTKMDSHMFSKASDLESHIITRNRFISSIRNETIDTYDGCFLLDKYEFLKLFIKYAFKYKAKNLNVELLKIFINEFGIAAYDKNNYYLLPLSYMLNNTIEENQVYIILEDCKEQLDILNKQYLDLQKEEGVNDVELESRIFSLIDEMNNNELVQDEYKSR